MSPSRLLRRAATALVAWMAAATPFPALAQDGPQAVSTSITGEARLRHEAYADPEWGKAPDDGYLWLRVIPMVKAEAGPVGVVVQPILAYARGVAGGAGPVDRTGIDLVQAYADLTLPLDDRTNFGVRGGRALIALGSERLVGKRYGPNVPQPFDGLQVNLARGAARLDLLHVWATEIGPGDFDDGSVRRRRLRSAYLTMEPAPDVHFDLYWIGYTDRTARFGDISGREERDTFGLRLFGQRGRLAWNWETMIQRGHFAGQAIRAWSQATETSVRFPLVPLSPLLRLRANIASGDRSPTDRRLGSFNAMFPKGRYFGELTPLGPRNIVNVNPGIVLDPGSGVAVEINLAAFWRASRFEGIYDLSGRELREPGTARARHIGNLAEIGLSVDLPRGLTLAASAGAFTAGPFIEQTGSSGTIWMAGAEMTWQF